MPRLLVIGCLLAHWAALGGGRPVIRSVNLTGYRALDLRELRAAMHSREGAAWPDKQLESDIESLVALYRSSGFYLALVRLDSVAYNSDSTAVDLTIGIREGDQARIGRVRCRGNALLSDARVLGGFETRPGGILDSGVLERDINALLSTYERAGHPFAKVEVENLSLSRDSTATSLDVGILIDEGPRVTVDRITVTGNRETKEYVIVREARLQLHEPYDEEKVVRIRQRLNRLGIFSKVGEPELAMTGTSGGLLINVEDGSTNTFDGILGYAPPTRGGESGTVSGAANVSMRNLFGTARRLDIRWQRDDSQSQEITLQYVEPWFLDQPVNLSGNFHERQQDSSYISRSVEARADLLLTESLTVGGVFSHSVTIPSSTLAVRNVSNNRTISTGLDLQLDTRDDLISPTGGALYRTAYRIGGKKVFGQGTNPRSGAAGGTVQKVSLDAEFYIETLTRQVAAIGLHGRQVTADPVELSDLYRFGGTNTLRGYRENEFLGSRIAWTNSEYRFILARHSYFFGFFDTGYYYLPASDANPSSQNFKVGYGIGIRMSTSLGNIGVSIAFGEGDSFGEGKLHLGLLNEF